MPLGQNIAPRFTEEESRLIQHAYERYDSDSRTNGMYNYEAFSDAVGFALRQNAVRGNPNTFDLKSDGSKCGDVGTTSESDECRFERELMTVELEEEKARLREGRAKERAMVEKAQDDGASRSRAVSLLKTMREIGSRRWEYELASTEEWLTESGENLRIGGHEATIRVPGGPEVTVVASSADAAMGAALRGALAALARQA